MLTENLLNAGIDATVSVLGTFIFITRGFGMALYCTFAKL
jgi:hypothetical protein